MAQPTIELPNMPDDWLDDPASAPASGVIPPLSGNSPAPGILSGLPMPPDWSLENSSINAFVDPETMKTIDFTGNAPPETPPWLKSDGAAPGGQDGQITPGDTQTAQNSPPTAWPVPGHTQMNPRDPSRKQGDGAFGSFRNHGGGSHTGIDITAPVGTPVVAAGDGTVANIQPNPSTDYGNQIVIGHPGGFYTQYGHLSRIDAAPGTAVHAGDVIGLSGTSGNVWKGDSHYLPADPHLHFEIRRGSIRPHSTGGQVVDPMQYLPVTP